MISAFLVVLEHGNLKDVDKLNLLSTCSDFWKLRNRVKFTSRREYGKVKNLPFINNFTNICTEFLYDVNDKHINLIRSLTYTDSKHAPPEFLNTFITPRVMFGAIPPHIRNLYVDTAFSMYSIIPEHVIKLVIYDEWERCIRIQDGEVVKNVQSKLSYDNKRSRPILRIKRKLHKQRTHYTYYGGGFDIFIKR